MSNRDFIIYTFDARNIIKHCNDSGGYINLNSGYIRNEVIKDTGRFANSALIDQIMKVLNEQHGEANNADLTKNYIYLDFGLEGIKGIKDETAAILENGIDICFQGDNEIKKFFPFDKSASMSRNNRISFICEEIEEEVNKRLSLGIDWKSIKLIPSKYYAYRGLYMTDGIRIENEKLKLNERNVLILRYKDIRLIQEKNKEVDAVRISDKSYDAKSRKIVVSDGNLRSVNNFEITPFDGEGLISPAYARLLRESLSLTTEKRATSFQIRMPFSKGMLHEVDFKGFIADQFKDENIDELQIEDMFGIKRELKDVEIIMTDSMFKCGKWLKKIYGIYENDNKEPIGYKNDVDPVKLFFERMRKYEHAVYIAGTNVNIKSDRSVRMNYQFLNTLKMDSMEFDRLIKKHIEDITLLRTDVKKAKKALIGVEDYFENLVENEQGIFEEKKFKSWEKALLNNSAFIADPKIKAELRLIIERQIEAILEGKIYIDGTVKYLSMDLLRMLIDLAQRCGVKDRKKIDELEKEVLNNNHFFIAGKKGYGLDDRNYYGVLRSPHLSRNEQCALRPYSSNIYNRYFDNLKGVIMTGYYSVVPTALSGADFDGDLVKVVFDSSVNKAILDGTYKEDIEDNYVEKSENNKDYIRAIPVALIDPPKGSDIKGNGERAIGKRITIEDLEATFSSRVGQISNKAIEIGRKEYSGEDVPRWSSALCTIATGLEIDSVKTGIYPDLKFIDSLIKTSDSEDRKSSYINSKRKYDKYLDEGPRGKRVHGRIYEDNKGNKRYEAYLGYKKRRPYVIFSAEDKIKTNIDKLPLYYVKQLVDRDINNRLLYTNLPQIRFIFETDKSWREEALQDEHIERLRGIIGAYRRLHVDTTSYEKRDYFGHIISNMKAAFDLDREILPVSGEDIYYAINRAYADAYNYLNTSEEAKRAIRDMKKYRWQFIQHTEERKKILESIVGKEAFSDAAVELICNTYDNGYQTLNFILEDTKDLLFREEQENISPEERKSRWKKGFDKKTYKELYDKCYKSSGTRSEMTRKANSLCRTKVLSLFEDNDIETVLKSIVALSTGSDKVDEKHDFLWGVFTAEDIDAVIVTMIDGD